MLYFLNNRSKKKIQYYKIMFIYYMLSIFYMTTYLILKLTTQMLPIVIGEADWCLMPQKMINSVTNIILSIIFPLARWTAIEMPSNKPPILPIAVGECATVKSIFFMDYFVSLQQNI